MGPALCSSTRDFSSHACCNPIRHLSPRRGSSSCRRLPPTSRRLFLFFYFNQSFVVLFAVCFLPMHVYFIWFYFDPNSQENYNAFWHALKIVGFVLAYINSCTNPIALYCVSTSFRKHFNRLLCCCKRKTTSETLSGGSVFAGNGAYCRDDGALMDDAASTAISQCNSRRVVVGTNSRSFKASANRRPVGSEGHPLNEFGRQQTNRGPPAQTNTTC